MCPISSSSKCKSYINDLRLTDTCVCVYCTALRRTNTGHIIRAVIATESLASSFCVVRPTDTVLLSISRRPGSETLSLASTSGKRSTLCCNGSILDVHVAISVTQMSEPSPLRSGLTQIRNFCNHQRLDSAISRLVRVPNKDFDFQFPGDFSCYPLVLS